MFLLCAVLTLWTHGLMKEVGLALIIIYAGQWLTWAHENRMLNIQEILEQVVKPLLA